MEKAIVIEIVKGLLQLFFALSAQANLTTEEQSMLLMNERERFRKNVSKPLPEVPGV
jgi:hypothetical protein